MSKAAAPALILVGVGAYALYKLAPQSAIGLWLRKAGQSVGSAVATAKPSPSIADGTRGQANPYLRIKTNGNPLGPVDTTTVDIAASYPIDLLRAPTAPDLTAGYAKQAISSAGVPQPAYGEGNDEFYGL